MGVDAVAKDQAVNTQTPTAKTTPPANRTSSGVADACSPGVERLPPVRLDVSVQRATLYSAQLGAIAKDPAAYPPYALYNAARNAVISAFGVNPADPNYVRKFHPENADVAAVASRLYMTHRLTDEKVEDKNLNLAFALDGASTWLVVGHLVEKIRDEYDKKSDPAEQRAWLESPDAKSALRNAAEWVNTPRLRDPAWQRTEVAQFRKDILAADLGPGLKEAFLAECNRVPKRQ